MKSATRKRHYNFLFLNKWDAACVHTSKCYILSITPCTSFLQPLHLARQPFPFDILLEEFLIGYLFVPAAGMAITSTRPALACIKSKDVCHPFHDNGVDGRLHLTLTHNNVLCLSTCQSYQLVICNTGNEKY